MKLCTAVEFENLGAFDAAGALERVEFCLRHLSRDEEHSRNDEVCAGLTFEELAGALLSVRRELKRNDGEIAFLREEVDELEEHNDTHWRDLAKSQENAINILQQELADAKMVNG